MPMEGLRPMQKRKRTSFCLPLGHEVPWCHHIFTRAVLENAMTRDNRLPEGNTSFKARAYLLKRFGKCCNEEQRVDLENDLNAFLLHKLQGGEPVPGLQVVREEVGGAAGWVDLEYPSNESERNKNRPRNRMVQDMMSKLGLKPVSRPRKQTGFRNRAVMKGRLYFDAESDTSEIPFLYRYQKNKKQYFLLVAMSLS
jgi:hypothetical protein